MNRQILVLLASLMALGMTTTVADGMADDRWAAYEYTADEVNTAATRDLALAMAPSRLAGTLNRNTPEWERVHHLFARLTEVAMQRSALARKLDWTLYLHEGRLAEAYSRAGGKIVLSTRFLEHYRLNDAELALVIGHEIAHALCEHERMNLSAVWRRNAPQKLEARYAMEFLDTEPWVRAQIAPIARLQERIADRIGLELVTDAGIDPVSALRFFDKDADDRQSEGMFPDVHDSAAHRKASLLGPATSFAPVFAMFRGGQLNCSP